VLRWVRRRARGRLLELYAPMPGLLTRRFGTNIVNLGSFDVSLQRVVDGVSSSRTSPVEIFFSLA